jgi:hypothetical protein
MVIFDFIMYDFYQTYIVFIFQLLKLTSKKNNCVEREWKSSNTLMSFKIRALKV